MKPTVTFTKGATSVTVTAPARHARTAVRRAQGKGRTAGGETFAYDLGSESHEAALEFRSLTSAEKDSLAAFFKDNPGQLNIRKAATPDKLYSKRVEKVLSLMAEAGVDRMRIQVSDGLPGGDGITGSEAVLQFKDNVLRVEQEQKTTTAYTTSAQPGAGN